MRAPRSLPRGWVAAGIVPALVLLMGVMVAAPGCQALQGLDRPSPQEEQELLDKAVMLQTRVLDLADLYAELYVRLIGDVNRLPDTTPEARLSVLGLASLATTTAVDLAAQSNPVAALVDLMSFSRLQQLAVHDRAIETRVGPEIAARIRTGQDEIRTQIWAVGADYFSAEELDSLDRAIEAHFRQNSGRSFFGLARVTDLDGLRSGGIFDRLKSSDARGFLAPVDRATREIREARLAAERALFVVQRMPLILSRYIQYTSAQILISPELQASLDPMRNLARSLNELAEELDSVGESVRSLPDELQGVVRTQSELLAALLDRAERTLVLGTELVARVDVTLAELDAVVGHVDPVLGRAEHTLETSGELLRRIDAILQSERLAATLERGERIAVVTSSAIDRLDAALLHVETVLGSLPRGSDAQGLLSAVDERLVAAEERIGARVDAVVDRLFRRALLVVGALVLGALVVVGAVRLTGRRGA